MCPISFLPLKSAVVKTCAGYLGTAEMAGHLYSKLCDQIADIYVAMHYEVHGLAFINQKL